MSQRNNFLDISERKVMLRIIDVLVVLSSLFIGFYAFKTQYIQFNADQIITWLLVLIAYLFLLGEIFQLYNLHVSNNRFQVLRSIIVTSLTLTLFYILTPYYTPSLPENRIQIIYFLLMIITPLIVWRLVYIYFFFSKKLYKSILIVGHSSKTKNLLKAINSRGFYNITSYVSNTKIEGFDNFINIEDIILEDIIKENLATEIIISTNGFSKETISQLNLQLIHLFEEGINIKSFESFYEEITNRIPKEYLTNDFYKNLNFSNNNSNSLYLFIHRFFDILIAIIGLSFFLVLLPFILIGNLFGNKGKLFYRQDRVGKNGKIFEIYKLRTMVTTDNIKPVWAVKNDNRITKFGKFLRKTRIDEIPQMINILKGDMSFIGPRPEQSGFINSLEEKIPFFAIRNVIRPGLTGWAQVNFPYAASIEEQEKKLRYDLYYIKERSLFLDFKILIKTISTVLFMKGQ